MFYMTLPSNSSFDHFPNNTLSDYTNKLPQKINLEGSWEVEIAEISYPRTWYNVSEEGEYWLRYEYKRRVVRVTLLPGFYGSPKDIVNELMKGLRPYCGDETLRVRLLYVQFANKVQIQMAWRKINLWKRFRKRTRCSLRGIYKSCDILHIQKN